MLHMGLEQFMECAYALRDQADSKEYSAQKYREELNALKDPYEDVMNMPEELKKKAHDLERIIHARQEQETAYRVLADFIANKVIEFEIGGKIGDKF